MVAELSKYWVQDAQALVTEEPKWGPIGREVYERTYSRPDSNGRGEQWRDTVLRVVNGNIGLVDPKYIEEGEAEALVALLYNFKAIPAGRHLWVSGVPGRQFLFNCHRAGFTDRFSRHFEFTFNELMKGGGVGANYSNEYIAGYPAVDHHVDVEMYIMPEYGEDLELLLARNLVQKDGKVPAYPPPTNGTLQRGETLYRVQDTREGWFGALALVLDAFMYGDLKKIYIDLSLLRPMGTIIKGFGGIASGPWALATLLRDIANFLNSKIGMQLSSEDIMQLDQFIAACVVAGNVRRSARMSIKLWKDYDILSFINCKSKDFAHWSTNISIEVNNEFWFALYDPDHKSHLTAMNVFSAAVEGMMLNGEPGFVNTSLAAVGETGDIRSTNPCGEIFLEPFENCNLGHVNLGAFASDMDGALEAFRLMQRYLIRATFGDITDPDQRTVVNKNRRTGVGIFGYQAFCVKRGVRYSDSWRPDTGIPSLLKSFKDVCDVEAKKYSAQLGINTPIKRTTVAPTGTIAKMPGTTEGIQTIYARYGIRRVLYGEDDPKLQSLFAKGYHIEDCLYTNGKVVEFPYKDILVEEVERLGLDVSTLIEDASEVDVKDFLAVQTMVQAMYADNSISLTINFPPDKYNKEEVMAALKVYGPHVKGTTMMPDATRPQQPYQRITKEEYEATGLHEVSQGEMECATGACPIK